MVEATDLSKEQKNAKILGYYDSEAFKTDSIRNQEIAKQINSQLQDMHTDNREALAMPFIF
jgi:hypothetical protein